jgi:lipopolysaccharide transport system ATP-binding protein
MSEVAIRIEGLRKRYRVGARGYRLLSDSVGARMRGAFRREPAADASTDWVWALDGVTLDVPEGEILGVIGRNGAGKSTLLKVLSRITEPTEGTVELHGRVGALLEVGTGFHPELTGRENLYLNGAILGMRRAEITRRLDDIVAFSGVERFLDTPLKFYSSGMAVRLGFAVAAHLEPEILIIDEVLAVGDVAFQERCLGKMEEAAGGGRTVLFVSHNMSAVAGLCPTSVWLDEGKIRFRGPSNEAIGRYVQAARSALDSIGTRAGRRGSGAVRVHRLAIEDADGNPCDTVSSGEPVRFALEYERQGHVDLSGLVVRIRVSAGGRAGLLSLLSDVSGGDFRNAPGRGRVTCFVPELPLAPGVYDVGFSCLVGRELADKVDQAGSLFVTEATSSAPASRPPTSPTTGPCWFATRGRSSPWSTSGSPRPGSSRCRCGSCTSPTTARRTSATPPSSSGWSASCARTSPASRSSRRSPGIATAAACSTSTRGSSSASTRPTGCSSAPPSPSMAARRSAARECASTCRSSSGSGSTAPSSSTACPTAPGPGASITTETRSGAPSSTRWRASGPCSACATTAPGTGWSA